MPTDGLLHSRYKAAPIITADMTAFANVLPVFGDMPCSVRISLAASAGEPREVHISHSLLPSAIPSAKTSDTSPAMSRISPAERENLSLEHNFLMYSSFVINIPPFPSYCLLHSSFLISMISHYCLKINSFAEYCRIYLCTYQYAI